MASLLNERPLGHRKAKIHIENRQLRDLVHATERQGEVLTVQRNSLVKYNIRNPDESPETLVRLSYTPTTLSYSYGFGNGPSLVAVGGPKANVQLLSLPSSTSSSTSNIINYSGYHSKSNHLSHSHNPEASFRERNTPLRATILTSVPQPGSSIVNSVSFAPLPHQTSSLPSSLASSQGKERRLLVASNDRTIRVYRVGPRNINESNPGESGLGRLMERSGIMGVQEEGVACFEMRMNHASISPDGSILLSAGDAPFLHLHSLVSLPPIPSNPPNPYSSHPLMARNRSIFDLSKHPRSIFTISTTTNPYASKDSYSPRDEHSSSEAIFSTTWSGDGYKLACGSQDGIVQVFDIRSLRRRLAIFDTRRMGGSYPNFLSGVKDSIHSTRERGFDIEGNVEKRQCSCLGKFWGVRVLRFSPSSSLPNSQYGDNREMLVFSEHRSALHIVDARTFDSSAEGRRSLWLPSVIPRYTLGEYEEKARRQKALKTKNLLGEGRRGKKRKRDELSGSEDESEREKRRKRRIFGNAVHWSDRLATPVDVEYTNPENDSLDDVLAPPQFHDFRSRMTELLMRAAPESPALADHGHGEETSTTGGEDSSLVREGTFGRLSPDRPAREPTIMDMDLFSNMIPGPMTEFTLPSNIRDNERVQHEGLDEHVFVRAFEPVPFPHIEPSLTIDPTHPDLTTNSTLSDLDRETDARQNMDEALQDITRRTDEVMESTSHLSDRLDELGRELREMVDAHQSSSRGELNPTRQGESSPTISGSGSGAGTSARPSSEGIGASSSPSGPFRQAEENSRRPEVGMSWEAWAARRTGDSRLPPSSPPGILLDLASPPFRNRRLLSPHRSTRRLNRSHPQLPGPEEMSIHERVVQPGREREMPRLLSVSESEGDDEGDEGIPSAGSPSFSSDLMRRMMVRWRDQTSNRAGEQSGPTSFTTAEEELLWATLGLDDGADAGTVERMQSWASRTDGATTIDEEPRLDVGSGEETVDVEEDEGTIRMDGQATATSDASGPIVNLSTRVETRNGYLAPPRPWWRTHSPIRQAGFYRHSNDGNTNLPSSSAPPSGAVTPMPPLATPSPWSTGNGGEEPRLFFASPEPMTEQEDLTLRERVGIETVAAPWRRDIEESSYQRERMGSSLQSLFNRPLASTARSRPFSSRLFGGTPVPRIYREMHDEKDENDEEMILNDEDWDEKMWLDIAGLDFGIPGTESEGSLVVGVTALHAGGNGRLLEFNSMRHFEEVDDGNVEHENIPRWRGKRYAQGGFV